MYYCSGEYNWDVMKLKKSPPVNLTRSEEELLEAVRTDPMLAQHLTDVLKNFKKETDTGMDAYQAELHVVEATRDLGGMISPGGRSKPSKVTVRITPGTSRW